MSEHIADIEKGRGEVIRIEISEFKEKKYLNIRTWYTNDNNELAPTKKGVAISLDKFDEFNRAVKKAEELIQKEL